MSSSQTVGAVVATAFSVGVTTLLGWIVRLDVRDLRQISETPKSTLETRVDELSELMKRSATLLATVTAEMDARKAEVERLQRDKQAAEQIVQLTSEQVEAIRAQVAEVIRPETTRGIRWAIVIGVLGFVAGAFAAVAVALFVHP